MFDFHKLNVYNKAKLTNKKILLLFAASQTIDKNLRNQIIRASTSILLNIAEGSGRSSKRDKMNFYIIAKGSAYECVSLLDIFRDLDYIDEKLYTKIYAEFEEITKMLFGLIKSLENEN